MPKPLIRDPEPDREEPIESLQQPIIPESVVEKTYGFWDALRGFGSWLRSRHVPQPVKEWGRDLGQEIWYSKDELARLKKSQGRHEDKTKFTSTPFQSFGPRGKSKIGSFNRLGSRKKSKLDRKSKI